MVQCPLCPPLPPDARCFPAPPRPDPGPDLRDRAVRDRHVPAGDAADGAGAGRERGRGADEPDGRFDISGAKRQRGPNGGRILPNKQLAP